MSAVMFEKIALIGVGLIGGSIALEARKRGLAKSIVAATRSAETPPADVVTQGAAALQALPLYADSEAVQSALLPLAAAVADLRGARFFTVTGTGDFWGVIEIPSSGFVRSKVPHRDFVSHSPNFRMLTVWHPDDSADFVDFMLVIGFHVLSHRNGNAGSQS